MKHNLTSKAWRLNNLYRIVDRDGMSIPFKMNYIQEQTLEALHSRSIILKARQLGMCLDPNTKILKSDFTWVRISDIEIGDEIIGVDEHPRCQGSSRKLKPGIVEGKIKKIRKSYKITFDNGKTLICTGEHRWLARTTATDCHWRSIEGDGKKKLNVGNNIRRIVTDTWETGDFEDGWIGGMLDGEGSLAKKNRLGGNIVISQLSGDVFNKLINYFELHDYTYRIEIDNPERKSKFGKKPVNKIVLSRTNEIFKLIGITRPTRFIKRDWWIGKKIPQIKSGNYSKITNIECIGEQEVIDLQTSIKTFIAEGYVSHNSTFAVLYILDDCLFNKNFTCGIVSYSIEHAQHIFKKIIGHALDTMIPEFHSCVGIVQRSAKEITFNNKSSLRVDTSLRGGSYQRVLVSEFGKTCARYPVNAEEVVTGTLNAVGQNGKVIIESTAEGNEGYYADMCMNAMENDNDKLTPLDYKLIFWSWHHEKSYRMEQETNIEPELNDYFDSLEKNDGIILDQQQKNWYARQYKTQGEKMKQEFPSTPREAFLVSTDAYFFSENIEQANKEQRLLYNSIYDPVLPVYVAMDIGINHETVIVFFQLCHGEIRIIDYYADRNKDVQYYANFILNDKKYCYSMIFLPHDVRKRSEIDITTSYEKEFRNFFGHTNIRIVVLPKMDKQMQINNAKNKFSRCVFAMKRVKGLVNHLMKYRKEWSEHLNRYIEKPFDDQHADYADAFCYMTRGVSLIEAAGVRNDSMAKHREAVANLSRVF